MKVSVHKDLCDTQAVHLNSLRFNFASLKQGHITLFSSFSSVSTYDFEPFGAKAHCVFIIITRIIWL